MLCLISIPSALQKSWTSLFLKWVPLSEVINFGQAKVVTKFDKNFITVFASSLLVACAMAYLEVRSVPTKMYFRPALTSKGPIKSIWRCLQSLPFFTFMGFKSPFLISFLFTFKIWQLLQAATCFFTSFLSLGQK